MSGGAVDSERHKLSENIWFVCSKCHIVEIWRDVTLVHTHTDTRKLKKELEFWKQNSQYCTVFFLQIAYKFKKYWGQIFAQFIYSFVKPFGRSLYLTHIERWAVKPGLRLPRT